MPTLSSSGGSLVGRRSGRGGTKRPRVDEGRQPALVRAGAQPRLHARHVARIDAQHEVGLGKRTLDGAMAEPGRALGAARRVRGLGDHIGNAERAGHDRAQPVGLAVVAMVREPEVVALRMARRQRAPALRSGAAPGHEPGAATPDAGRAPARPAPTRLVAGMTTLWPSRFSSRDSPRAISRSPEAISLSGGLSGVCSSTRMVSLRPI